MPKIQLLTIVWPLGPVTVFAVTRLSSVFVVGTLLLASLSCQSVYGQETAAVQTRVSPVVKAIQRTAPAVVNISGRKPANQPQQLVDGNDSEVNGMGTGLIIDSRGYVLTNHHVIAGIDRIQVRLSRIADVETKEFAAQIVAVDSATDLAVIKIEAEFPLPVIPLATSSDLMLGETVIAIGNAYGYEDTITRGIISCLQRQVQVTEEQVYQDLIQTDASINPGNSGGPLINIHGEAIGINVAVRVGAQAIGFAIPMDRAMKVVNRILRDAVDDDRPGGEGDFGIRLEMPLSEVTAVIDKRASLLGVCVPLPAPPTDREVSECEQTPFGDAVAGAAAVLVNVTV